MLHRRFIAVLVLALTTALVGPAMWSPASAAVNPATLPGGLVGTAYSQTITADRGPDSSYTFAVTSGTLPGGLALTDQNPPETNMSATLSGTPTTAGSFTFTVTARGFNGRGSVSRTYTVVIVDPNVVVAPATLPDGTVGATYDQDLTASGGTAPYTFSVTSGTLPVGVTLSPGGSVSGTPTIEGSFTFEVTAVDSTAPGAPYNGPFSDTQSYTVVIGAPTITVSPDTLPDATVYVDFDETISATGGTTPHTFAVTSGALPAGLTLGADGELAGTPTADGTFDFTVTATDSSAGAGPYTGSQEYTLVVAPPTITVSPDSLPDGAIGSSYSQSITASGGEGPYTFAVTSGALPAGLTLSPDGTLSGTPSTDGSFEFTVTASDANGFDGSQTYSVEVPAEDDEEIDDGAESGGGGDTDRRRDSTLPDTGTTADLTGLAGLLMLVAGAALVRRTTTRQS